MQCVLQGKESELGLVSQEVLTRESRSWCPHCPHGTHRTPRTPQGELRVSLCSTRSLLSTQNTQGCSQILGVAVWRATGRWWQGSISSFLSSVSLFSMCGVGRNPRREGSHLPQLHRQFAAGFSKGIYVELMVGFFSVNAWEHSEQERFDGGCSAAEEGSQQCLVSLSEWDAGFHFSWW